MHFTKLSAVLLGLAAFTSAIPNPHERQLLWAPRSLQRKDNSAKNNNKEDITIVDTTIVELTEESKNSEVELTILVEEKIKIEDQKKKAKDNVRKNHYRNKNKNVNTIIIVVTEIIDIRDSKNQNKRYMKHQVSADNKANSEIIVQVTEVVAITISSSTRTGGKTTQTKGKATQTKALAGTAASGAVAHAIQTVDPNAPFKASNQTVLMPSGAAAPQGQNVDFDPAAIVEDITIDIIVQKVGN